MCGDYLDTCLLWKHLDCDALYVITCYVAYLPYLYATT
jgi:hypothetical protein